MWHDIGLEECTSFLECKFHLRGITVADEGKLHPSMMEARL